MPAAINEEAAKAEILIQELQGHTSDFKEAQREVSKRFDEIIKGKLSVNRIPTAQIINQVSQARAGFREFLNGLSEEETTILTIAFGPRWRSQYDAMLDPAKDPQFKALQK